MKTIDHYKILGISSSASTDEVKAAFRDLALRYHPDRNGENLDSNEYFLLVKEAYEVLSDERERSLYDKMRRTAAHPALKTKGKKEATKANTDVSSEEILDSFRERVNCLLWNIEDFVSSREEYYSRSKTGRGGLTEEQLFEIMMFFDKWLLTKSGYPDQLSAGRSREEINVRYHQKGIRDQRSKEHFPFSSVSDYFYSIRLRSNEMMRNITVEDLRSRDSQSKMTIGELWIRVEKYLNSVLFDISSGGTSERNALVKSLKSEWLAENSET